MASEIDPAKLFKSDREGEAALPASEDDIRDAEEASGVLLPEAYKAMVRYRNGGYLRRTHIDPSGKPGREPAYCVPVLPGINTTFGYDLLEDLATVRSYDKDEVDFPEMLIPLNGDGHWWLCLDYRTCGPRGEPGVVHFDFELEEEYEVAPTFEALVRGMWVDPENASPAIIALDAGAPTGAALDAVLDKLGCTRFVLPSFGRKAPLPMPPQWRWGKYKSSVEGCEATIEVWRNRWVSHGPRKTEARPDDHPLLEVQVHPQDAKPCLAEIVAALGAGAAVLHGVE